MGSYYPLGPGGYIVYPCPASPARTGVWRRAVVVVFILVVVVMMTLAGWTPEDVLRLLADLRLAGY